MHVLQVSCTPKRFARTFLFYAHYGAFHRVGRTARAGKTGSAVVMLAPQEEAYVNFLKLKKVMYRMHAVTSAFVLHIVIGMKRSLKPLFQLTMHACELDMSSSLVGTSAAHGVSS
jgi:hypothetical protein